MISYQQRVLEHYTDQTLKVTTALRLPLIALLSLLGWVVPVQHFHPAAYRTALLIYAGCAVLLLVLSTRERRWWFTWLSTGVDVAALATLSAASGGASSLLQPVFALLPIVLAFQYRPALTGAVGAVTAVGYLVIWLLHPDRSAPLPESVIWLHFAFLLWLAGATTGLSVLLVRRSASVLSLLEGRQRLVADALSAEERERARIAEHLHDGPLQDLLAARWDLEEALERCGGADLERAQRALLGAATELRSVVSVLHPQVLSQLGLGPALRELAAQQAQRAGFEVVLDIDEQDPGPVREMVYSLARELLTNVAKHAHARTVAVDLRGADGEVHLTVTDDGVGFDPEVLPRRLAQGHIGLSSQYLRVQTLGGDFDISAPASGGTRVHVTVPT
ncbi:sensor histidine kinase [Kineococcus sp. SYSU DK005]|uniref:sensor histidine kinase n=1 Tax=Kineococcus sp. SYSU DK005 TaxID=3383126 RepID=UPI003D7D904C